MKHEVIKQARGNDAYDYYRVYELPRTESDKAGGFLVTQIKGTNKFYCDFCQTPSGHFSSMSCTHCYAVKRFCKQIQEAEGEPKA